jgi:hypothetical protein
MKLSLPRLDGYFAIKVRLRPLFLIFDIAMSNYADCK